MLVDDGDRFEADALLVRLADEDGSVSELSFERARRDRDQAVSRRISASLEVAAAAPKGSDVALAAAVFSRAQAKTHRLLFELVAKLPSFPHYQRHLLSLTGDVRGSRGRSTTLSCTSGFRRLLGRVDSSSFHPTLGMALQKQAGAARGFRQWADGTDRAMASSIPEPGELRVGLWYT